MLCLVQRWVVARKLSARKALSTMKKIIFIGTATSIIIASIMFSAGCQQLWRNWSGCQRCSPLYIFQPNNLQELREIILRATSSNRKIRAYGSSYSWSPIVCTDYLINTDKLNRILRVDTATNCVRVEAGIKLYELNHELAKIGLALPNQSFTQAQSLAGALATATHGTGHTGTLSDFAIQIELVTADGRVHLLTPQTAPEEFAAARVNIGALGIIYAITLQCTPLFKVSHARTVLDWNTLRKSYLRLYNDHDYFMFYWNPYTNKVITYTWDKVPEATPSTTSFFHLIQEKVLLGPWINSLCARLVDWFPHVTPYLGDIFYKATTVSHQIAYPHDSMCSSGKAPYELFYGKEATNIPIESAEIAIPIEKLVDAAGDIHRLVKKYLKLGHYIFMCGILFRFVNAEENTYLSPAAGQNVVFVNITSSRMPEDFYREFEELMLNYNGRPHWGKINFLDYERTHKLYGEKLDEFNRVRMQLDPHGTFSNPYVQKVCTPGHFMPTTVFS